MNNEWDIDNLPNRLTMFRVILIPIIIFSLSILDGVIHLILDLGFLHEFN